MRINTALALLFAVVLANDKDEEEEEEETYDTEKSEVTSLEIVSSDGYTMTLEYYTALLPEDEFSPLYLYFETTLDGNDFKEGMLIS